MSIFEPLRAFLYLFSLTIVMLLGQSGPGSFFLFHPTHERFMRWGGSRPYMMVKYKG